MKKSYQTPTLVVKSVSNEDVLTASKLTASELPGKGDIVIW